MSFRDSVLRQLAHMEREAQIRDAEQIAPTRFEAGAPWRLVSLPFHRTLSPLIYALDELDEHVLCTSLPPFWQLDMLIAETAHVSGRIHAPTSYTQHALVETYIKELRPRLIVTSIARAHELHQSRTDASCALYAIAPLTEPITSGPWKYLDLHLIPGLSCAYQCPFLVSESKGQFHPTAEARWTESDSLLTLEHPLLPAFGRAQGAGTLHNTACRCGATTLLSYA